MTRIDQLEAAAYALPEDVLARLQTPALVVDLDRVRRNVGRVLADLDGDASRWRVHVKTTKIPRVWAELPRAGVRHFKCATTREADLLGGVLDAADVDGDVLLAYPLRGPGLSRLAELTAAHPRQRYSVLCEDPAVVPDVPSNVEVFVDLDPGMHRTGIPGHRRDEILAVAAAAGQRLRGLHSYEGHLHDGALDERRARAFAGYDELLAIRAELEAAGHSIGELVTSGTPGFRAALAYAPFRSLEGTVHRVSPGTVVYHDQRTEVENPDLDLEPAAVVLARVVSWPGEDIVTCDAGSKALAAEVGDPVAVPIGFPHLAARTPNEEHLPFDVTAGERPARGTVLALVPGHVCPTINLADEALLVEGGRVVEVARVAGRGHELMLG